MPSPTSPHAGPAVVADHLVLAHHDHVALAEASFALPAGKVTALVGPNGSGKSTLLDAMAGLLDPVAGTLAVFGGAPSQTHAAYVLQTLAVNPQLPLSAREVVAMGRYRQRGPWRRLTGADRAEVTAAMARLDVDRLATRPLASLSGGERQRVLVAQALVQRAPLLLLDEPVTGLDLPSRDRILEVLGEQRAAGTTVVVSTHDLAEAAAADHVLLLAGRVVAAGAPAEALDRAHLAEAYGALVLRLDGDELLVDEGAHHPGEHGEGEPPPGSSRFSSVPNNG